MAFLSAELTAALSVGSNIESPRIVSLVGGQKTTQHVFSSKPKVFLAANVQISQLGSALLAVNVAAALHTTPLAPQPRTTPYRILYSSASSNVGRDHVDPPVPKLVADLPASLTIKALICLATLTTVDRRALLGDLLLAFTSVRRS